MQQIWNRMPTLHLHNNENVDIVYSPLIPHEFVVALLFFFSLRSISTFSSRGRVPEGGKKFGGSAVSSGNMDMVHLYDSKICRLCAGENGNEHLFINETGESDLCSLVNRYLPLKVG